MSANHNVYFVCRDCQANEEGDRSIAFADRYDGDGWELRGDNEECGRRLREWFVRHEHCFATDTAEGRSLVLRFHGPAMRYDQPLDEEMERVYGEVIQVLRRLRRDRKHYTWEP